MEIWLIVLSTVLFGSQFIFLNLYQNRNGKSFTSILFFIAFHALAGAFIFACLNGFHIGFSPYTLLYSGIAALIQMTMFFAGIKALSIGRVEIYTLFNVAGGMSVAYIFGITYFNEEVKIPHIIGLVLILLSLLVPIILDSKSSKKSPIIFWILCFIVFLANGFFGVVNKIHITSLEGLPVKEYMFYVFLWMFTLSIVPLSLLFFKKSNKPTPYFNRFGFLFAICYGLVNSVGMFLQYAFADKVPASILFPLSNGGAIVFAIIFTCLFYRKKPKLSDIIQFLIALGGMVLFIV